MNKVSLAAFNAGCKNIFLGIPEDLKGFSESEYPESVFNGFNEIVNFIFEKNNDNE